MEGLGQRLAGGAALVDGRAFAGAGGARLAGELEIAGVAVTVERGRIDIERAVVSGASFTDQLVDRRGFERGAAQVVGIGHRQFGSGGAEFEQRVGLDRLADKRLDLEVGQRQQLDRLLKLRGHHQRLGLPQIEARA